MKLHKISVILLGLVPFVLPSCKKYLNEAPDNRTEINSVDKVAQLVSTAYPTYDYLTFTESSSDNAEDKGVGIGSTNEMFDLPYAWIDVIGAQTNSTSNYWNGCYEAIAAANQALEAIEKQDLGTAVLPYKGEALVARAYAHFMLVMLYSNPYEIGGANTSPGVPYITAPETKVIVQYSRGTVKSTYEKIEQDLLDGIKLLSASAYKVPKFHFTPAAAHAFAARFYLFKGEWQKAVDHATLTVPGNDFVGNIRPITTTLKDMTGEEFNAAFNSSSQKYNLLLSNNYSTYHYQNAPRHGFGDHLVKMFTTANVTGKILANRVPSYGVPNYTTYKYKGYFFNTGPGIGFPYLTSASFTVDEALMNRAEAYAELGQFDAALKDINDFYSVRINGYNPANDAVTLAKISAFYSISDPKEGLVKTILDAKKAEFLQEGIRWFDIIRRRLTVVHNNFDATGLETFTELKPDDKRRVFQLPKEVKLSGIELNPR
ncbi:RagB/SusD family nutrient uptake outer membrane protein [Pedobacter sp.]|jgi:hypothetical protein|uniref:RagB/SusD family nutrient uptake outer membrane protein n=1 Tax=Pedobacter sp. TaxID=1411316 RepID=UPI002CCBE034|nr:RagB/SusD family nutrient uptake outer membrane protein [Pedobacter sp.]HWW42403.1 RagB/SusD family nutrient uptake outer membrane protein [Pedobacter sp.]